MVDLINSKFNEYSLGLRLEKTLDKYNLNLSDEELGIYKNAREKRNAIIHGKKNPEISRSEFNIISKIIYLIMKTELFKKIIKKNRADIRFENPLIPPLVRIILDQILKGLNDGFPSNLLIEKLQKKLQRLTKLGMPILNEIDRIKLSDVRIPQEFDQVLEELVTEVIKLYPNESNLLSAFKLINTLHYEGDFHMVIKTILDDLVRGLLNLNSKNEYFQKAQNNLDQLTRLGIPSLRIFHGMKGFERWKRKEKLEKESSFKKVFQNNNKSLDKNS